MLSLVHMGSILPNQEDRDKQCRVNPTPGDKGPVGPMPETGDQEYDEDVADGFCGGHPTASQRDVDVIPKPGGEGDVPSAPELGDIPAEVGSPEVGHELEAEELGRTDCDIRVAGEVSVDLEGE